MASKRNTRLLVCSFRYDNHMLILLSMPWGGAYHYPAQEFARIHEKKFGEDVSQDVRCRPDYRGGIHRKFLLRHNVALMLIADFVEQYGKVPMLVVLRALGTLVGRGSPAASFIVVVHIEP